MIVDYFSDTKHCLRYIAFYGRDTHFAFIGDSRIRELYLGFVTHLEQKAENSSVLLNTASGINLVHVDNKLKIKVDFTWSPDISSYMVNKFK